MATSTTNLGLIKPSGSDKIRIAQINQNMDLIDAAVGPVGSASLQAQAAALKDGLAIVSNNNTHAAITSGQYVYVYGHGTLAEGLYVATANIGANGTLSGSNLTAVSGGGLNALNANITNINTPSLISVSDFNSLTTPGRYSLGGNYTNAPKQNLYGYVDVVTYGSNTYAQTVYSFASTGSTIYERRLAGSTWGSWEELVLKSRLLQTYTNLFEFTGTSSQTVTIEGDKTLDGYALLQFDLFDSNGTVATQIVSPLVARGSTMHYIYGSSSSMWASYVFTGGSKDILVNRSSSTTTKLRCFGIS